MFFVWNCIIGSIPAFYVEATRQAEFWKNIQTCLNGYRLMFNEIILCSQFA